MKDLFGFSRIPQLGSFSDDDRRACLPTIAYLEKAAVQARGQGGMASLKTLIVDADNVFLKIALKLVATNVIGESPAVEVLWTHILSSPYKGADLLKRVLIMEGMCAVARGDSLVFIREKLLALLGDEFYEEACKSLGVIPIYDRDDRPAIAGF